MEFCSYENDLEGLNPHRVTARVLGQLVTELRAEDQRLMAGAKAFEKELEEMSQEEAMAVHGPVGYPEVLERLESGLTQLTEIMARWATVKTVADAIAMIKYRQGLDVYR